MNYICCKVNKFLSLFNKRHRLVIGILSGTSVDAVDIVLTKITGSGVSSKIKVIDFKSYPIDLRLKNFILECSSKKQSNVEDICKLNFVVGNLFASNINKFISGNKLNPRDIDLIGSHGQTIYHYPSGERFLKFSSKSTLQIGDLSVIANQTGITTVGDFRAADIAAGGSGAPLVPYLDRILFSDNNKSVALINIGGISNVTYLKKGSKQNEIVAFDTGPGNMIIDFLMKKFFDNNFDRLGKTAASGKINKELFEHVCKSDKFYLKRFPKSTGREYYIDEFLFPVLKKFRNAKPRDVITTFTMFTAYTIFFNLKKFRNNLDEIIFSGGGTKNITLMKFIGNYLKEFKVSKVNKNGINTDNKEAVLFAVLANEIISGKKANITSVTGASGNVYLGKICIA